MKSNQSTNTTKAKPFLVRLPSVEHRTAYERYCADNLRSLDGQASILIIDALVAAGYLESKEPRTGTQ